MKTTSLLIFSLFLITGSLFGQMEKFNLIDSDIRKQFFPIIELDSSHIRMPNFNLSRKFDYTGIMHQNRFYLLIDTSTITLDTIKLFSDFVIAEEIPGASKYYGYPFVIRPDTRGKILIKKPDTTSKYYLIIKDPIRHTISR